MSLRFPPLAVLPLERYASLLDPPRMEEVRARTAELRGRLAGRAVWNVSSTAVGGGVAEMVRSLLAYARGAGVDARWAVITGPPSFFRLTKRLHNALHDSPGDGSPLGPAAHALFRAVAAENLAELAPLVRPGDVVIVHDPQPAGLIAGLADRGARVLWRCHVGFDRRTAQVGEAWRFLAPYLERAAAFVFTRAAYAPSLLDADRVVAIPPSLDPFSVKNQPLSPACARDVLVQAGVVAGDSCGCAPLFVREDGTPGRVDRCADVVREGPLPPADTPLLVQVSRWDRLKDPLGVLRGYLRIPDGTAAHRAHLVLAGPSARGVSDDPEGAAVHSEVVSAWRALPAAQRARVHVVSLPTADVDENAAMVNALQRCAQVVIQKSLAEGFGLTVAEAMWKGRPVVASAVGGIVDQIVDGQCGVLLPDPRDEGALSAALCDLCARPSYAAALGAAAHRRVLDRYLGVDSLLRYGSLIERLDDERAVA